MNLSTQTMRKLVKLTSGLFLNRRCPLWLQRKGLDLLGGFSPLPKGIAVEKKELGGCEAWWFKHKDVQTKRVILYFHGGGFGVGSPRSHRDLCAHLAKYSDMSVVSLKYRLAPEHPYPAAIDDALAAYLELLHKGYENHQIALAGDSAGGSLALTLALKIKAQQGPQPACLFLISPWVNKSKESASHLTQLAVDPVINEGWSRQMSENYLQSSAATQAEACLVDKDFTGLPPMLIHVGTDEVLLDDSLVLKQKALKCGVHINLITYPELWHVFHFSASLFKQAREALKQAGNYIKLMMA